MEPADKIKELINKSDAKTTTEVDNKILAGASEHLEQLRQKNLAAGRVGIGRMIVKSPLVRLAAAAVIIVSALVGVYQITAPDIAWADVTERFRTVPFFSVSIYIKEDATSEPQQMELWMSRKGKTRIRLGTQVIFGNQGKIVESFDIKTHARIQPDERAIVFLRKISEADEFSLDSIIRVMFGGTAQEVTPLINPDAVISEDMVVFDVELPGTPEWVRIWALRESRLPVRIRVWDPRDGAMTDAVFEYSKEQADEFFDPNSFENLLSTHRTSSRVNLAYAFLKDPGGKKITPEDMFAISGYHVPQVRRVGITPEGAVWVTAGKGRNRTPNGNVFDGFSRIEDDLGRTYFNIGSGHLTQEDVSYDIFVPIDYPFDDRKPSRITFFCEVEDYNPKTTPELVGSVDMTEWEQNAPFPDIFGSHYHYTDTLSLKISLAYKLFGSEHAKRLNRLLETIPDWSEQPRNKSLLIFLIRLANKYNNDEEVVKIGEVLTPLIFEKPERESRYFFREYIIALARTGQIDNAAELFRKIDAIDEMSPEKSDERYYQRFLEFTAESLVSEAELTAEQISKIFGFDISQQKEFEPILERAKQTEVNRKNQQTAEKRLNEISDYYDAHPLPERIELLERTNHEAIYFVGVSNTLPGHEDYKVLPINYPIKNLASSLRYFGDIVPPEIVPVSIEDEGAEQTLFADLVYMDGITPRERAEYVLGLYGMELVVEEAESMKVLVAKYDGRPLKNAKDVKAPFRNEAKSRVGMMTAMARAGFPMKALLQNLAYHQTKGLEDGSTQLVIVDETGIEGPVSSEMALWSGDEGLKLAKEWFKENFGVSFTEETRKMKTYVVRKRKES